MESSTPRRRPAARTTPPPTPLSVERIVATASELIRRDGLGRFSMRRLGAELGVDPMAVYHHVADKRSLLTLVTARAIGDLTPIDPSASWDDRVRQWTLGYWDVVAGHRDLVIAGLSDPDIGAGGLPTTRALLDSVADSGLAHDLVEPTAYLIVDAVHGSALAADGPDRDDDRDSLRAMFATGLDTIIAGIAARSDPSAT